MAVGLAFAVVGAGLITSFYVFSGVGPNQTIESTVTASSLELNRTESWSLFPIATDSGKLTLSWYANAFANVSFWPAKRCPSGTSLCPTGAAVATWPSNLSGTYENHGRVASGYVLRVTNVDLVSTLDFNATLAESYTGNPSTFSPATWVLITVGATLLLGTGAIGIFLGLFLPSGVYRRPSDPSEMVEDLGDLDDPMSTSEDDGSPPT